MRKNPNLTFHDLYKTNNDDRFDIISGLLNKNQKRISPKYFYDEVGSSLFDKITNLKDYYPTKKEIEILEHLHLSLSLVAVQTKKLRGF